MSYGQAPTTERISPSLASGAQLAQLLARNTRLADILGWAPCLGLSSYYLAAGAIAQTVWNVQSGRPPERDIADYDLVYYDDSDLTEATERAIGARAARLLACTRAHGDVTLDVCNEARVHLWYEATFGHSLTPYRSVEQAIGTFPTTATSVGVRRAAHGALQIHAPFGLDDLLAGIVRPNKRQIRRERYEAKVARWRTCWPHLRIESWDATPS